MRLSRLYQPETMRAALCRIAAISTNHAPPPAARRLGYRYDPQGNVTASGTLTLAELPTLAEHSDARYHLGALYRHEHAEITAGFSAATRRFQALMLALPILVPVHPSTLASARRQYDTLLLRTMCRGAVVAENIAERLLIDQRPELAEWYGLADDLKHGGAAALVLEERRPTPPGGLDARHDRTATFRLVRQVRAALRVVGRADLAERLPAAPIEAELRTHLRDLDQSLTLYPADPLALPAARRTGARTIGAGASIEERDAYAIARAREALAFTFPIPAAELVTADFAAPAPAGTAGTAVPAVA